MIVLRAVRVEDDGAETDLGEVRLTEAGAVFSHLSTLDGGGVIADLRSRLQDLPRAYVPRAPACGQCMGCSLCCRGNA